MNCQGVVMFSFSYFESKRQVRDVSFIFPTVINEVCLFFVVVVVVADLCVLHQLSSTLHQPEPSGAGVQWPAALPL